ncbi:DUF72 domain-containing protein [Metabacillus iocasae]|uniref:Uncharacterized protein YecE (DUF72 family) n=1 Tax=Priestia iocasae TaxID=2291674 RepID=A0ABS2R1F5_9BACI|nr:DUF72 domain-containing protein [Metabacillus iocasae]MBM7704584.1 uncharacterized protein YecE (DUF72 family) [Metabacillus iocasae]
MIYIGVTGWGDHDVLYEQGVPARDKLAIYAGHFPIVEVDASFYAIQPTSNAEKWIGQTPDSFQFIVKAYQGMTGHQREQSFYKSKDDMFEAFIESIQPYVRAKKLGMILFQTPPWFDCTKENVHYLRYSREKLRDFPVALEFRNQTWFSPTFYDRTLTFMEQENWIHGICDEPQAGEGSVPIVLHPTDKEKTLIRFHGRNVHGWNKPAEGNWREVRFLYRYNEKELMEWKERLTALQKQTKDIYLLFNNNSGGDAVDNAKQMIQLLGLEYEGLAPKQLDFFEGL